VLSVGTLEARKNHSLLYAVWNSRAERGVELPRLVIVGRPGLWDGDVLHALAFDPSVSARVDVFSDVNDDQLLWLYQHCRYTVYPSIYEGWGCRSRSHFVKANCAWPLVLRRCKR